MLKRFAGLSLLAMVGTCLFGLLLYQLPPVNDRLAWRVNNWRIQVQRALLPAEKVVFVPEDEQAQVGEIVQSTLQALPSATSNDLEGRLATSSTQIAVSDSSEGSNPPTSTPGPTLTPTPIPNQVSLAGIAYEQQGYNNCGPANLSMALSYWGWQGDQYTTRAHLRPSYATIDDKNVMPAEMADFVETQTPFKAVVRVGGDVDLLKRFIAAGFPVLIEKGHHPPNDWWMGHYLVLNAYDDGEQRFIAQDSLIQSDFALPYAELVPWWRNFNYVYLVIYPPERKSEVYSILGPHADETFNYQYATQMAQDEISNLSNRDLYFAWYNLGTNLVALSDYAGAAQAYDQAFRINASLPEKDRLYRMLWYQDGPYQAYFYTGRLQDIFDLGNATLYWVGEPVLEETFYWLGLAREAQGDIDKAVYDLKKVIEINPNNILARQALQRLGVSIP